jgi:tetratricopeptide (TPR) repeat protein
MRITIRRVLLPVILAAFVLFPIVTATAQTRSIKGKVVDDKGQPIVGVQISILGIDMARNYTTKTDKKGQYIYMLGLQAGTFRIVARAPGFQPQVKENVKPELSEAAEVNFELSPGEDYKLPFEMSEAERADYMKRYADQEKRKQAAEGLRNLLKNGVQLTEEGKYPEAIAEFNKALQSRPDEPGIYAAIANAYTKLGKNDEALLSYQKAVSLNPNDPNLYKSMGMLLNSMGKIPEAQEAFKKSAELNPASSAQDYYNIGVTMVNSGQAENAAEAFKKAIAADANFSEAYYQLGMALSGKQATIPAAIEALKKYVQIGKKPEQVEVAKQLITALGGKP